MTQTSSASKSRYKATQDQHYARGVVLVLIAGCFWSIAGLVVRLMHDATEWQILFYRSLALVATLLLYVGARNRGDLSGAFRRAGSDAALAGAFLSIGFACWIFAMTHTTIANALFVLSAAVGTLAGNLYALGAAIVLTAILAQAIHGVKRRPPVGVV